MIKGESFEDRQGFDAIKKKVKIFNWSSCILTSIALFLSLNNDDFTIVGVVIPLLMIVLVRIGEGKVRLFAKKISKYPELDTAFLFSLALAGYKTVNAWQIPNPTNLWVLATLVSVFWIVLVSFGNSRFIFDKKSGTLTTIILLVFIWFWAYGAVMSVNVVFDNASSEIVEVKILRKEIGTGRTKNYYLTIAPWAKSGKSQVITVHPAAYDKAVVGQTTDMELHQGALGIAWYRVEE